jgi:hypothetical protein
MILHCATQVSDLVVFISFIIGVVCFFGILRFMRWYMPYCVNKRMEEREKSDEPNRVRHPGH